MLNKKAGFSFVAVGFLVLFVAASAAQANPWLSTPSGVMQGDTTVVLGGAFSSGELVLVTITSPSGETSEHWVEANDNDKISVELYLDQAGAYLVEAWNIDGVSKELLASAHVIVAERLAE